MGDAEHRLVVRSFTGFAIVTGIITIAGGCAGFMGYVPILGAIPSAFLAFPLGLALAGKFFPSAGRFFSDRCKNYRRVKKGLEPLAEHDPSERSSY